MAKSKAKSAGNMFVWGILGLLILSLAGFGIGSFGGTLRNVATVGDQEILVQDYANALQQEQRRLSQQTGQNLSLAQMQTFGFDRLVLERLIALGALDHEAARLELSVGDGEVAKQIRENQAFQGLSGGFDRDGYSRALRNAGLTEKEYEADVRADTARALLQGAIVGGVQPSDSFGALIASHQFETRNLTFAIVTPSDLPAGQLAPSEAELEAHYTENAAAFTTPETRELTVAWITPDRLVDEIEISADQLQSLYDARRAEFSQPARVIAERLGFADRAAAQAARDGIDAGQTSFEALVEARGLTLDDVDQGELAAADLPAPVAEALFALEGPGIVGPLDTSLGPVLYRVNAVLAPVQTPLAEVTDLLRSDYAMDQASRRILDGYGEIDDLLAAGATLEELGQDTDLIVEKVSFRLGDAEGLAGYDAFRAAALAAAPGDFPELLELDDGGLFALRLDAITPATLPPLSAVRDAVQEAWSAASDAARVLAEAERIAATLTGPEGLAEAGLRPEEITDLTRDGFVDGVPSALIARIFAAEPGSALAGPGAPGTAILLWLDSVQPADFSAPEVASAQSQLSAAYASSIAQDLFESYGQAIQTEAGLSINQAALNAVHASFTQGGAF